MKEPASLQDWVGSRETEISNPHERLQKQIGWVGAFEKTHHFLNVLDGKIHSVPEEDSPWLWIKKFRYLESMFEYDPLGQRMPSILGNKSSNRIV